jgi:phosphohistidine phosphatase
MKELWLLRHAKSDRKADVSDIKRSLKKRGKRDAKNMGIWLKSQHLIPNEILSSPATRAIETTKIIYKELQVEGLIIQEDARLYASGIEQLKTVLASCPETIQRVLLVGHNPELEDLLKYLVKVVPDTEKLLPTSGLVRLSLDCAWSDLHQNCAQMLSITYAKSLLNL